MTAPLGPAIRAASSMECTFLRMKVTPRESSSPLSHGRYIKGFKDTVVNTTLETAPAGSSSGFMTLNCLGYVREQYVQENIVESAYIANQIFVPYLLEIKRLRICFDLGQGLSMNDDEFS